MNKHGGHSDMPFGSLYEYLDALAIWDQGEDAIAEAKATYRKQYKRLWRKRNRNAALELSVAFPKEEAARVRAGAKAHHLTITAFIRAAVNSYFTKRYIVPNTRQLADMEVALVDIVNHIRRMTVQNGQEFFHREERYQELERQIAELNHLIRTTLSEPKLLQDILPSLLNDHPELASWLQNLLNANSKGINP